MAERIEGRVRELLEGPNFAAVATVRPDGAPAVNVIWVDVDEDGRVVLNSAEGRRWPQNLRRDPRATVTVVNRENPYEYAQIRGRLSDENHEDADENIDRLARKYLGEDTYPFRRPGEQRVMLRIEPEHVLLHGG
jgi:PPOX class probable F420-dependent enzyme